LPPPLSRQAWQGLNDQTREADNQARLDHHARPVVVATPTIRQVAHAGRRLVLLNRHQISARRGLIITGPPATGKTTAITQLGKNHELLIRRQAHPGPRLPVVYVTVPPAATPKMLAVEFARFLGLPIGPRTNQADITNAVCHVLCELCTDLVIVDELHNLSLATRNGAETSDQLKYFSERIPATFIYAGVDVERAGLFSGTRGKQLAGRFATIPAASFPYGTATQRADWQALVATLEQALRLHCQPAGALLRLDRYLHQRTDRQPVAPDPRGSDHRDPGRQRTDHQGDVGVGHPRPRRRAGPHPIPIPSFSGAPQSRTGKAESDPGEVS
jgi:hypothetical protein